MDNSETLTTLGTQDTQDEDKQTTENWKDEQHGPQQKPGLNTGACER